MHDTLAQTGRGYAIDTAFLSAQLEGLAQGAMGVSVRESWLSWAECDVCAAAFHR